MSITAEYRQITEQQLAWFLRKPSALYELLFPENFEEAAEQSVDARQPKTVANMLGDFRNFTQAMQNPGTNDELVVSKLPMMLRQWRAMLGEDGAQEILKSWAQKHPAIARHLSENPLASERRVDDARILNIDKAWDGIHFVLTGSREPSDSPLSRAIFGDRMISDDAGVTGYGPAHVLTSGQVNESARTLRAREPSLSKRFDPGALMKADVYAMKDEPELIEYLTYHYGRLLGFYEQAAAENHAMVVYMV